MAVTRRAVLRLLAAGGLLRSGAAGAAPRRPGAVDLDSVKAAPWRVVPDGEAAGADAVRLTRSWDGALCRARVANTGRDAVRIREVVVFDLPLALPPDTTLYGEGFQMLSQTGGTLGRPVDLGDYTDAKHYRMPQPEGARVVHGLVTLSPPGAGHHLFAFTSARRFNGQFYLRPARLEVVVDTEGLALDPGEARDLEEFTYAAGPDREALMAALARRLSDNHPTLVTAFAEPPSGWCSWYCFGPRVTAAQVLANLDVIARAIPGLKYIQIDDGYQAAMGDWLETGDAFGGGVAGAAPSCSGATTRSGPRWASSTARAAPTTSSARGRASKARRARTCSATGRAGDCGGTTRMRSC